VADHDATGHVMEAASKEETEEVVMASNNQKILQTQNPPFMQEPLVSEVGWLGVEDVVQGILNGYYDHEVLLYPFTVKLIVELAQNEAAKMDNPDCNITSELWTDYWKSAKERTSSASEILQVGVFKSGAHHPIIVEFDARMANAAIQSRFSQKLVG
jgi:hypothetical protein